MFLLKLFCNVPEGSGSRKYNMYFPVDKVTRKIIYALIAMKHKMQFVSG